MLAADARVPLAAVSIVVLLKNPPSTRSPGTHLPRADEVVDNEFTD
jgi:hypothetical protein